ncbi:GNAT family N-acetyltransferase [Nonomuraea sp. WAC 01424]|uniref:GNAT family N-acetyltransferase n=1 Tax=Nonomuraea sp. WAC 01424 TaxID=2203200 RepID=UPI00289F29B1|nr:GNAT family N-acetyltransferase [Nonomuraea sp. WAC 01424]
MVTVEDDFVSLWPPDLVVGGGGYLLDLRARERSPNGHVQVRRERSVLVASTPAGLVGYCVVEYTFFEQGFVTMLMVAEPARGHGVGERLLRAAAASCQTAKLFTSTNLSNHPMQRLLQRVGWRSVGMVHGLDEGDPEVFYLRTLPSTESAE